MGQPRIDIPEGKIRVSTFTSLKLAIVGLITLFVLIFLNNTLVYISPYEFGIKQVKIGIGQGIQKNIFEPGWHIAIPGFSLFHLLPSDIQIFDLTNRHEEQVVTPRRVERAAHIQTSDGFYVDVDVSILYRIVDAYQVVTTLGPGEAHLEAGILPRAEPVLKQTLGTLTTEEFYDSHKRTRQVAVAKELLQKEIASKGLQVEQILIRYFQYSPEIQKNIEEKKLKDQMVFKNQSEKRAATEEAALKKVVQEGEAQVQIKLQEGESYITRRRADQELYLRKRRAEGDLAVKLAEAYRTDLKNTALQGVGSEYMVGLKMAEVLNGVELLVLPSDGVAGFNPIDLDKTARMFGISKRQ